MEQKLCTLSFRLARKMLIAIPKQQHNSITEAGWPQLTQEVATELWQQLLAQGEDFQLPAALLAPAPEPEPAPAGPAADPADTSEAQPPPLSQHSCSSSASLRRKPSRLRATLKSRAAEYAAKANAAALHPLKQEAARLYGTIAYAGRSRASILGTLMWRNFLRLDAQTQHRWLHYANRMSKWHGPRQKDVQTGRFMPKGVSDDAPLTAFVPQLETPQKEPSRKRKWMTQKALAEVGSKFLDVMEKQSSAASKKASRGLVYEYRRLATEVWV